MVKNKKEKNMEITITNLKKIYGTRTVLDIDAYTVRTGEILGLVGNNGAGKTTLFRLILDLLKADEGNVHIGDIEVSQSEVWKDTTGAYMDESFLIDYLTPEEYFYFVGKMCGLDKATVDERLIPYERFMNGEILGQRFGVRQKERIKEYRKTIDVLTLTATPIPRTLQMSLMGIRGLSQIETPPKNRQPVQTYVVGKSNVLIKQIIERELARDGQVFYLYNRTNQIANVAYNISISRTTNKEVS